jgi:hypothetical protein
MAKKLVSSKYRDLGLVIDATSIANDALAYSEYFYNLSTYKRFVFHCKASQAWELYCTKMQNDGTNDWGNVIATGLSATSTAYSGISIYATTSICGYGLRFGMKNKSGAAAADFELYVQCID